MTLRLSKLSIVFALAASILLSVLCPFGLHPPFAAAKKKAATSSWIMTHYADLSGKQGMFYTLYNPSKKKLIVVDGGWSENAPQVRQVIRRYGGTVHAWILTHYHDDHIEAFNKIYAEPKGIRIKDIYVSPMDYAHYLVIAKEWDDPEDFGRFLTLTQDATNVHRVKRDDSFVMAGLTCHFLNTYDNALRKTIGDSDLPNNGSLMFRLYANKDSVLFCGDAHSAYLGDYLIDRYEGELESTYVQVGHHGNNSFPTRFYRAINPKYALFDAPLWLIADPSYSTAELMIWCQRNGIKTYDLRIPYNQFKLK